MMPNPNETGEKEVSLDEYVRETDPSVRIDMAQQLITQNSDALGLVYIIMSSNNPETQTSPIESTRVSNRTSIANSLTDTEQKEANRATDVLRAIYLAKHLNLKEGDYRKHEQNTVDEISANLGIELNNERELTEPLLWFLDKLRRNEVIFLENNPRLGAKLNEQILETERLVGTPFSFLQQRNIFLVCLDLVQNDFNESDLMIVLAHEHGHELLKACPKLADDSADTDETIFNEFFPMMEELREYELLKRTGAQMSPALQEKYEVQDSQKNNVWEALLPNSNIIFTYRPSEVMNTLVRAYSHSVMFKQERERNDTIRSLKEEWLEEAEIVERIRELDKKSPPLIDISETTRNVRGL